MPFRNGSGAPKGPSAPAVSGYSGLTLKLHSQSEIGTFTQARRRSEREVPVHSDAVSRGLRFNSADHALDATVQSAGLLLAHGVLAHDDLRTGPMPVADSALDESVMSEALRALTTAEGCREFAAPETLRACFRVSRARSIVTGHEQVAAEIDMHAEMLAALGQRLDLVLCCRSSRSNRYRSATIIPKIADDPVNHSFLNDL